MNRKEAIRILQILGLSILFSALTIAIVYFVTTRRAPTAPVSVPKAAPGCYAEFFFPSPTPTATVTPTGTPTETPTPTPTATVTPTPVPGCGEECTSGENTCEGDLVCAVPEGSTSGFCAIAAYQTACQSATAETAPDVCCNAPTPTVTPTPTPTNSPTPTPPNTPTVTPSTTPNPTATPTETINTPTPTNTPIPIVGCQDSCSSTSNCPSGLTCMNVSGVNRCVNASCPYSSNCVCTAATNTPTPTPPQYVAKAAAPTEIVLPQAGVTSTTWTAIAGGAFLILLGIIFFAL